MTRALLVLAIWVAVSIPVALLIGAAYHKGDT